MNGIRPQPTTSSRAAATAGFLLCVPIMLVLLHIALNIEPHFGPLQPLLTGPDGRTSTWVAIGAFVLVLAALVLNVVSLKRAVRSGDMLQAHPATLALTAIIVAFLGLVVVGIVVDQYPCWTGVPNCD